MTTIVLADARPVGRRGFEIVLPNTATDGAFAVVEAEFPPGTAGPPVHLHPASDETYYILSGMLLMYIDGEVNEVSVGGLAHISRGTPHTYSTRPGIGARWLTLHNPGGYEQYHTAALRAEHEKGGPLEAADLFALAKNFDWALAGDEPLRLLPSGVLVPADRADEEAASAIAVADRH
jgi:mannose-6-phosphate isomerase-like protein (cupin superfamily)